MDPSATSCPGIAGQLEKIGHLPLIQYVNETAWIFAIIETAHLLSLAILGGAVLVLNLRLLEPRPATCPRRRWSVPRGRGRSPA